MLDHLGGVRADPPVQVRLATQMRPQRAAGGPRSADRRRPHGRKLDAPGLQRGAHVSHVGAGALALGRRMGSGPRRVPRPPVGEPRLRRALTGHRLLVCPRLSGLGRSGGDPGFQRDARARSLNAPCASAPRPSTWAPCCSALAPMASLTRDRPPCWGAVAVQGSSGARRSTNPPRCPRPEGFRLFLVAKLSHSYSASRLSSSSFPAPSSAGPAPDAVACTGALGAARVSMRRNPTARRTRRKRGRAAAAAVSLAAVSRGQGRRQGGNARGASAVETRRAHTTAEASTRLKMPSSRASPLMRKLNSPLPFIAHDSCASGSRSQRRGRAPAHHCVPCAPAPRVALSAAPQRGQPPPSLHGQSPGGAAASGQLAGRGGGSGARRTEEGAHGQHGAACGGGPRKEPSPQGWDAETDRAPEE